MNIKTKNLSELFKLKYLNFGEFKETCDKILEIEIESTMKIENTEEQEKEHTIKLENNMEQGKESTQKIENNMEQEKEITLKIGNYEEQEKENKITIDNIYFLKFNEFSEMLPSLNHDQKLNFFTEIKKPIYNLSEFIFSLELLDKYNEFAYHINVLNKIDLEDLREMDEDEFLLLNENFNILEFAQFYQIVQPTPIVETPMSKKLKDILLPDDKNRFIKIIKWIRNNKLNKEIRDLNFNDLSGKGFIEEEISDFLKCLYKLTYTEPISKIFHRFDVFHKFKDLVDYILSIKIDYDDLINFPNFLREILPENLETNLDHVISILKFCKASINNEEYDDIIILLVKKECLFNSCLEFVTNESEEVVQLDLFLFLGRFNLESLIIQNFKNMYKNLSSLSKISELSDLDNLGLSDSIKFKLHNSIMLKRKFDEKKLNFLLYDYYIPGPSDSKINDPCEFNLTPQVNQDSGFLEFSERVAKFKNILIGQIKSKEYYLSLIEENFSNNNFEKYFIEFFSDFPTDAEQFALYLSNKQSFNGKTNHLPKILLKNKFEELFQNLTNNLKDGNLKLVKTYQEVFYNFCNDKFINMTYDLICNHLPIFDLMKKLLINESQFIYKCVLDEKNKNCFELEIHLDIVKEIKEINLGVRDKEKIKKLEINMQELKSKFEKFYSMLLNDSIASDLENIFIENNMTENERLVKYISSIEVDDKKLSRKIKKFAELFEENEYKDEDIFDLLKDDFSKNSYVFIEIMKILKKNSLEIFNDKIPDFARVLASDNNVTAQIFEFYNELDFELDYFTKKKNLENINFENKLLFFKQCLNSIDTESPDSVSDIYKNVTDLDKYIKKSKNFQQLHIECLEKLANQLQTNYKKILDISDMMELDNNSQPLMLYDEINNNFHSNFPIIDIFVKLFFDSIKRKESISTHLNNIKRKIEDLYINQFNLTRFILDNSNPNLKVIFLYACTKFMPIPFLSQNFQYSSKRKGSTDNRSRSSSVNEFGNKDERPVELYLEIFYILNETASNMLSFHLSSESVNYPKGKSKLLNDIFGRSFLIEQRDLTKYQNIEIHFDKHFENPLDLNIADYHGKSEESIINSIIPFFNYYIIHIHRREYEVQIDKVRELQKNIQNYHSKNFKIILLIHNPREDKIKNLGVDGNIISIETMELDKLDQRNLEYLKSDLWKIINFSDLFKIKDAHLKYLKICENLKYGKEAECFKEKFKYIDECINVIERFKDDFKNPNFLPFNNSFDNYSNYNKKINKLNENNDNKNFQGMMSHLGKLQETYLNQKKYGVIYNFHKIYNDEYFIGNLLFFTQKLKTIVQKGLKEPNKKLNENTTKMSSLGKDNVEEIEKLKKENDLLKEEIYKKTFSYEFIVRELYHIWITSNEIKSKQEKEYYLQLQSSLIETSNPFEVMDGDNLHFISKYYTMYFSSDLSDLLVVSIIGPQSSGKSTLLNFLFGTQFASSSGRCTKGMYGTLIRIKNHPIYKKLLILDTEGILSAERNDPIFDRKLFLFCLSISNAVIMCVRNEVNREMSEIIRLAVSCLSELKLKKLKMPSVYFVLNALTDINKEALWLPLNKIREDINLSSNDSQEILRIDEEHVILLPFAFTRTSVFEGLFANIPSLHFSYECLKFREKLLNEKSNDNIMKLNDWFELAEELWKQIDELRNLIDYSNLEELNQDKLLKQEISNISEETKKEISSKVDIDEICKEATLNFDVNFFTKHSKDGKIILNRRISQCIENSYKKYIDYCNKSNISFSLNQKRKVLLDNNIKLEQNNYEIQLDIKINEVKLLKSRLGSSTINEYTRSLLANRGNIPFTTEEAKIEFEIFWRNENLKNIEKSIPKYDEVREESFKTIYQNYSCQTNKLPNNLNLRNDLRLWISYADLKSIITKYLSNNKELLLLKNNISPNLKDVTDYLVNKSKNNCYLKIKERLFTTDEKIQIEEIDLKYGLNIDNFIKRIERIFNDIKGFSILNISTWGSAVSKVKIKIQDFYNDFEKESQSLNLKLNLDKKAEIFESLADQLMQIKETITDFMRQKESIKKLAIEFLNIIIGCLSYQICCNNFKINNYHFWDIYNYKKSLSFNRTQYDQHIKDHKNLGLIVSENKTSKSSPSIKLNHPEQNFLNWYEHRDRKKLTNDIIFAGIKLFQSQIDWEEIINSVCLSVYNSYRRQEFKNPLNFRELMDIIKLLKSKTEANVDIQDEINEFKSSFHSDITMSVINGVNNILHLINNSELDPIYFELNQMTIAYLHEIAMILLAELHSVFEYYKKREPIRVNNKDKENSRNYFISLLTKDRLSADKSLAQSITNSLLDYVYRTSEDLAKKCFNEGFDNHKSDFEPALLMSKLDELIEKDTIENSLDCILRPQTKFDYIFNEQWNKIEPNISKYSETKWIDRVSVLLNEMVKYFESLIHNLKVSKLDCNSLDLFTFELKTDYGADQFLTSVEEKTMCDLIGTFFKTTILGTFDNEMLREERKDYFILPKKPFPKMNGVRNTDLESLIIHGLGSSCSIGNLCVFLGIVLEAIHSELNENSFIKRFPIKNLDSDGNNQKLKQKFHGCHNLCKLCGRKCDEDHTKLERPCKCYSGHRFKVFGGTKIENVDFPSFFFCDKMKDNDPIIYGGKRIKWKDFKNLHIASWDYSNNDEDSVNLVEANLEKNKRIWKRLGKHICEYYTNIENIKINYIDYTETIYGAVHLILMLDESGKNHIINFLGSMGGQPWNDLIKSIDTLFNKISNDVMLTRILKCTVINYASSSRTIFQEQNVTKNLVGTIDFRSGGTCFLTVMNQAIDLIDKTHSKYDVVKLVMMSDGGSTYPTDQVRFLNSKPYRNKLNFESIMFGTCTSGIQTLSKLSEDLGGKFSHAVSLENLTKSFVEVVNIKFG